MQAWMVSAPTWGRSCWERPCEEVNQGPRKGGPAAPGMPGAACAPGQFRATLRPHRGAGSEPLCGKCCWPNKAAIGFLSASCSAVRRNCRFISRARPRPLRPSRSCCLDSRLPELGRVLTPRPRGPELRAQAHPRGRRKETPRTWSGQPRPPREPLSDRQACPPRSSTACQCTAFWGHSLDARVAPRSPRAVCPAQRVLGSARLSSVPRGALQGSPRGIRG